MSDPWNPNADPAGPEVEADPTVVFHLRSLEPPEHGPAFWDELDASLGARRIDPAAPLGAAGPPTPPPAPLAELSPPPPSRWARGPQMWLAAAAAVLVVLAAAALIRTATTDVETTPAANDLPVAPSTTATVAPTTTAAPATTAPAVTKPVVTPTTAARATTTTTRPAALTLSPDGLGTLRIGMTGAQATATGVVGPFSADELAPDGSCGFAKPAGIYQDSDFAALFLNGRLARIYVYAGSRLRTPQGIGVGSASSRLTTVPGARSEAPHPYQRGTNVYLMTGDVGYQFTVENGKVSEWSVGTKNGLDTPEGCA